MTTLGCAASRRKPSHRVTSSSCGRAEEIAAGLVDEMAARGDVIDLIDGYARRLPMMVICELLGIPVTDREWILATVID